ncbi:MAG: flagellar protein FliT [Betaproteobacteria bacterium HGW-Betaproteobacteria-8]|nr:MAG: flagellar protein FliT [Betaproteobacteria bacterium HGW-Betaproteobacteria-8]
MTNRNTTLRLYAEVVSISEKMLAATQDEDWELLEKLEAACAAHMEDIRATDKSVPLSKDELKQKIQYIEKILATDKQIRYLVEPWMARLSDLMRSGDNRQKLRSTYGMNIGH